MITPKLPPYLNEDFILNALDAKNGAKKFSIKSLKIERNTLGGNYSSDIYRAKVQYEVKKNRSDKNEEKEEADSKKVEKANLLIKDLFSSVESTSQEHFTYVNLLPTMEDILTKAGIVNPALSPKLYMAQKAESELHVFEDMGPLGYIVCDRYEGFNLQETKIVIEKLANFHAASMVVMHKHADLAGKLREHFWLNNPVFSTFVKLVIDENIKHIAEIIGHYDKRIAERMLQNTGAEFERRFFEIFNKSATKINVIAHGDLWIKNILVKHGSDDVEDVVFIDFQNCLVCSPAVDLQNLLITSASFEVFTKHRSSLVEHYYLSLCSALKKCNSIEECIDLPTFEEFIGEMERVKFFTFYALAFAFPQTNLSEELCQDMDFLAFFEPTRLARNRLEMFQNPRVLKTLQYALDNGEELLNI